MSPMARTARCLLLTFLYSWCEWRKALAWSSDELLFYDNLRSSPEWVVDPTGNSNVVGVDWPTIRSGTNDSGVKTTTDYRLCHIPVILPLTDGNGKAQFGDGIFPSAAAMLAMLHFNERNGDIITNLVQDEALRNCDVKFTMGLHDSEYSPIVASRVLLEDLLTVNHSLATPKPCAMVGSYRSAVTGPLATMATVSDVPVVTSISTSSQLDNKSRYGLLGRTIPSDEGVALATVQYLREVLNVTHCGVLYVRDPYGTSYSSDFTRAAHALEPPMVVKSVSYEASGNSLESIQLAVDQLAETGYNFFLGITNPQLHDTVIRLAGKAKILGKGKFWILADGAAQLMASEFSYSSRRQKKLASATSGIGMIEVGIEKNKDFDDIWALWKEDSALEHYFRSKMPQHVNLTDLKFRSPTRWEYIAYDTVMALGMAACRANESYFDGSSLFSSMKDLTFGGASGHVAFDRMTGSRDVSQMSYTMTILNANPPNTKGRITFNRTMVARLGLPVGSNTISESSDRKWTSFAPTVYSDGSTVPPLVLPEIKENLNMIKPQFKIAGLTLAASVLVLSTLWMIWTIIFRNTPVVQKSQKECLLMLCVGSFVMACAVIPMSLQEPLSNRSLDIACMSIPWLFQVGFVLAFSALASKTSINNSILQKAHQFIKKKQRAKTEASRAIIPFALLSIINVTLLVVWTAISPSKWERTDTEATDIYGRSIASYGKCSSSLDRIFRILFLIFDACLLVLAIILYYKARHVASLFNENFYILISMSTILQAFAIGTPSLVLASTPKAQFLTRSVLVTVICYAVLLPMFIPKEVARKGEEKQRAIRASINESRWKLQRTWSGLFNGSSRIKGELKRSKPDFFSSIIYETGEGSRNSDGSEGEECFGTCTGWSQGLDDLAL